MGISLLFTVVPISNTFNKRVANWNYQCPKCYYKQFFGLTASSLIKVWPIFKQLIKESLQKLGKTIRNRILKK